MGSGFAKKKKEAKLMQQQLSKMQDEMSSLEVTGSAGNGLVQITLNGDGDLKKMSIKPECVDPEDIEGLETLIKAAHADAKKQIQEKSPKMPGFF